MNVFLRPTKELLACVLAVAAGGATIASRLGGPPAVGALPRVPALEGPADVAVDDVAVAKPRLVTVDRPIEGRDPFVAADLWEDAQPLPLPLPPEGPRTRVVPVLSIGGGRALAPAPRRIAALPVPVKEQDVDEGGGDTKMEQKP